MRKVETVRQPIDDCRTRQSGKFLKRCRTFSYGIGAGLDERWRVVRKLAACCLTIW